MEDDGKMTGGAELIVMLLGIGFRIRYAWDFENSEVGKLIPSAMESAKRIEIKEYAKSEVLVTESQREALPPRTPVEERQEQ